MRWQKKIISGLGIGSFIFLMSVLINGGAEVESATVLRVFAISLFAALTSAIFDWKRIKSFIVALCIHYVMVFVFILCSFQLVNEKESLMSLLLSVTVLYGVSYGILVVKAKVNAKELNTYLELRKKNEKEAL